MAFVVNRWLGIDGNWNNISNWSRGAKPVAGDVALFDKTSSTSVTINLDQTASPFKHLYVSPKYGGNHGFVGSPLSFTQATGVAVWRGNGQAYWNPSAANTGHVVCDTGRGQASQPNLTIGGFGGVGGVMRHLAVKSGYVNVIGDMECALNVYVVGDAARVILRAKLGVFADPAHIFITAGLCDNYRTTRADKILMVGDRGRLTQIGVINVTTEVVVSGNGKFKYLPTSAPGTNPPISFLGGTYDESDLVADHSWGMTVISPDMAVINGAIRNTGFEVPSLDLREEYPGEES